MKKLLLSLMAIVMLSCISYGQKSDPVPAKFVKTVTITIAWEAGKWCFKEEPGCKGSVVLKTAPNKNGKFEISWDSLDRGDFEMPTSKLFSPKLTNSEYYVYIPKQILKYNRETNMFEGDIEFFN